MSRGKLILMKTKKPPKWEEWREMQSRKEAIRKSISMIQSEARAILDAVTGAETTEQACEILRTRLPDRRHVTYWLGQISRRKDVRLGQGKDFPAYVTAVVESIRARTEELVEKEEKPMGKRTQKPVVVVRKGRSRHAAEESGTPDDGTKVVNEVAPVPTDKNALDQTAEGPKKVQEPETMGTQPVDTVPEQTRPMSRVQEYALKTMRVFADCAVQRNESGVYDVLACNFGEDNKALLNFWLWKAGYNHLTKVTRNKDLFDSIRIISRELYREMHKTVGKRVAWW